jgi:hypothetical protein
VQPFGTALEAPAEPTGALVEATDEHEQIVGAGVDTPSERHDGPVEFVDRCGAGDGLGGAIGGH